MRKRKAYLGQNKNPHNLGRAKGNGLKWVVPRMLREYFDLRRACGYENHAMKINMNKAFGMMGKPYPDLYKTTPSNEPVVAKPKATSFPDDGWQNVDQVAHLPVRENGSIDVMEVAKHSERLSDRFYAESFERRKKAKQGFFGHLSIQAMRELLKPAHERV